MSDENSRYAVCYPDGIITVLGHDHTFDDALEYLRCVYAEAEEHSTQATDELEGTHLARVRVEIVESYPNTNAATIEPVIGRA